MIELKLQRSGRAGQNPLPGGEIKRGKNTGGFSVKALITGGAGFIGSHTVERFCFCGVMRG